jgi:predicted HTH domain antitoxin
VSMMKEVVLQVPEEIQDVMGQRRDLAKEIIKRLAVSLYAERKISLGKAVELSGADHFTFMELLGDFGVNLDYDEEDLDADLRTIRGLKSGGNM